MCFAGLKNQMNSTDQEYHTVIEKSKFVAARSYPKRLVEP